MSSASHSALVFSTNAPELIDDELLAWSLQLEEIDPYGLNGRGKYPAGHPPDNVVAFESFQVDIESQINICKDRKLAYSIAHAVNQDSAAIAKIVGDEDQAQSDREFALLLTNGVSDDDTEGNPNNTPRVSVASSSHWMTTISAAAHVIDEAETGDDAAHMGHVQRQANALNNFGKDFQCCVCFDNYRAASIVSLSCRDQYCRQCLKELFIRATRNETLYPPRCCRQQIDITIIAAELTSADLNAFQKAGKEFSSSDRTYCSNVECGMFIPPEDIMADKAFCTQCGHETCGICKSDFHRDMDCPADPALHQTLALAASERWQRCYACGQLVQISHGCYHMTCKCGAQFCYRCGERWKTCRCADWDEHRLYDRAQQVVRRDAPTALPLAQMDQQVEQIRNRLRDNPGCAHDNWTTRWRRRGDLLLCEMCEGAFPRVSQCTDCHVTACDYCRRNRMR